MFCAVGTRVRARRCGFCVPRPQLLKRWLQAGVLMRQITGQLQLIYPPSAHDYEYYKVSSSLAALLCFCLPLSSPPSPTRVCSLPVRCGHEACVRMAHPRASLASLPARVRRT